MLKYFATAILISLLFVQGAWALDQVTIELGGTPLVVPVNATNKAMLTYLLAKENAKRAGDGLVALTLEQFARDLLVDMFRGYKIAQGGLDYQDACATWKTLTTTQQNSIISTLGGHVPCP